ncbi:MAG: efflux transporter outer membrane subunit [Sphingomonadaceae bacterium]
MRIVPLHRKSATIIRCCLFLPLAAMAAGCATLPEKSALQEPAPVESLASTQSLAAPSGEWPSDRWWETYGDRQLSALIDEGLAGATDLRIAQARFDRAQAIAGQARAPLLPSLSASAEAGATQQSDNYLIPPGFGPRGWPEYGQIGVTLNWQLDFWGRNRAALAAARSDAAAAGAEAAAARLQIAAGIAGAYADLGDIYAQRDAVDEAIKVREQTLGLMREREKQGLENRGAVNRAMSALAAARQERAAMDEAVMLAGNGIAALLGAGPDRGLGIARPQTDSIRGAGLPDNLPAELIGRRPDIVAARWRVEASQSRIGQAKAAFYPNINLAGLIGLQALGLDNVFRSGSDFGNIAPAISLPIFDGGRLRGQYREAEAGYSAAVAQYDGVLVQALREVADATASQRALVNRLENARQSADSAQAAWTIAQNRYRGGLGTYLDVLAAEDAMISSRRIVASLEARAFTLDVALTKALGGGFRSQG